MHILKGKKSRRALLFVLCMSVCVSSLGVFVRRSAAAESDATVQSYEAQLADLQAEQDRLMSQINALRSDASQANEYKASIDQLASATQTKIVLSEALLTQLRNQIAMTEQEIADIEAQKEETMSKYLARVKETREEGNASYIELILGSEGISDFLTRVERVNSIFEYDRNLMNEFEELEASLRTKKVTLDNSLKSEEDTKASLEADRSYYDSLAAENQNYINSLASDENALLQRYNEIKAAEDQLNAELESYIQQQQAQSQVVYSGEGFIRPIASGTGYVSSGYGWRELWGQQDFHGAVDVACPAGTNIMASSAGTVIRAEWHYSYGYYVIIDHGNGISTLYAHCSALLTSVGAQVNQGDVIALVGCTGSATGDHVHVEVRVDGQRVDPNGYIAF